MNSGRVEMTEAKTALSTTSTTREKGRGRRRSATTNRPETPRAEESLQWVTARFPPDLVREIEAHAKHAGTTRSDAIRECLAIGMETIRGRESVPGGRVDELLGALESIRVALDLLARQLSFLARLDQLVRMGSQFIIATHSPILMAYPEARILELSQEGIREVAYEDTEHFRVTRDFLLRRERMLRELFSEGDRDVD